MPIMHSLKSPDNAIQCENNDAMKSGVIVYKLNRIFTFNIQIGNRKRQTEPVFEGIIINREQY